MNTKIQEKVSVNPKFAYLFEHKTKEDKYEHDGKIFSAKVLNEVQKICNKKKINRLTLAQLLDKTPSYITQLFTGVKNVNPEIIGRMQDVLGFEFEVKARAKDMGYADFLGQQAEYFHLLRKPLHGESYTTLFYQKPDYCRVNDLKKVKGKVEVETKYG